MIPPGRRTRKFPADDDPRRDAATMAVMQEEIFGPVLP